MTNEIPREPTILIVDDNPANLGVIVEYLEEYGFRLRIARTGEQALERAKHNPPDLILLDILMPDIDGFEICRRLKHTVSTRDIPVMFMTSLTSVEDKVRGFELGAIDYVTKPLNQEEVLVRIQAHLDYAQRAKALQAKNEQLYKTLTQRLNEIQEVERQQLARELHDEVGQVLTAIKFNLSAIKRSLHARQDSAIGYVDESIVLTEQLLEQIRDVSLRLRPLMLDDLGLEPTLRWLVKNFSRRVDVKVNIKIKGISQRLPPQLETALYRIVQESLTNIARHSEATNVNINLHQLKHKITLFIEDNGIGFDFDSVIQDQQRHGLGLHGIQERVSLLDGRFELLSQIGSGTQLLVEIPHEVNKPWGASQLKD